MSIILNIHYFIVKIHKNPSNFLKYTNCCIYIHIIIYHYLKASYHATGLLIFFPYYYLASIDQLSALTHLYDVYLYTYWTICK